MSYNKTKRSRTCTRHNHRRKNKNGTIRKVMRGCNGRQYGGTSAPLGMMQVPQSHGGASSTQTTNNTNTNLASSLLKLQMVAGNKPPVIDNHPMPNNFTAGAPATAPATAMSGGSHKSKHKRLRYKKSIARRGRSRRFRKTKRH